MTANKILKKIWSVTTTVIVTLVVLIAVFLMGFRIAGFRVFSIISGSMEPKYSVGDLIYVKEVDPNTIKVGDPITFVMNEKLTVATHQVIAIDAENQHFYTQGLANDTPDVAPVHFNNLIGKPMFAIPLLGYVSDWIQHPPGTYIAITLGILWIAILFLPDSRKKEQEEPATASAESDAVAMAKAELEKVRAEISAAKAELEATKTNGGNSTE